MGYHLGVPECGVHVESSVQMWQLSPGATQPVEEDDPGSPHTKGHGTGQGDAAPDTGLLHGSQYPATAAPSQAPAPYILASDTTFGRI